ncbi:hypothetical protein DFQ09_1147 [Winogradskyella pacifica]|uniref:Uncharacterized protein n=1 Tax=Winogradskyella pacifica TaxID=664642 RepID=A0A3D9LLW5_9FLAO|nr:hypothetical protein [Winogradskyella pacifica]REE07646.1 hypothetical protein DFQ09_1147 [Winogradskyella pacifica]
MNLENRSKILSYSLELEYYVSLELAKLLDIKDFKNSKSLGNKSSSLSLNQKLNLLLDFETISSKEKSIIESFSSIRNQFMHNIDATSYEYVINQISGLLNRLTKLYPENFKSNNNEMSIEKCVENLYIDSIKILSNKKGKKLQDAISESIAEGSEMLYENLDEAMSKNLNEFEKSMEKYSGELIPKSEVLRHLAIYNLKVTIEKVNGIDKFKKSVHENYE